jgi:RND family efflux transporter MFP subunit
MKNFLLPLSVAALLLTSGCRPADEAAPAKNPGRLTVTTTQAQVLTTASALPVSGLVKSRDQGTLAAQTMGTVIAVSAQLGAKVKSGEVLVRLSSPELTARLAQAKAGVAELRREHDTETRLLAKGASTREGVATLRDRLAGAEANLAAVQAMVDHLTVKAPFAGSVSRKFVEAGDLAVPGRALLELQSLGASEIEAGVPATAKIPPVGTVLRWTAGPLAGVATLKEFGAGADAQTQTRRVVLTLAEPAPAAGTAVTVAWPGGPGRRVAVATSALGRHGQLERVWVVGAGGRIELRLVRSAGQEGDLTLIASGLVGDERIVDRPAPDLVEGTAVEIK